MEGLWVCMFSTFRDVLLQTVKEGNWRYYDGAAPDLVNAERFIQEYLLQSGKLSDMIVNDLKRLHSNGSDRSRITHTQHAFLLGFYIYKSCLKIKNAIDKKLKGLSSEPPSVSFRYVWFLICFFHDLAYSSELSDYNIDIEKFLAEKRLSHLAGVPLIFRSSYKTYFKCRYHACIGGKACIDHGIYGGLRYYQELKTIRKSKAKYDSRHNWARDLNRIYNYCSWIILGHNIWFAYTKDKAQLYRSYGLSELIIPPYCYKVRIDKHPLLFLFQVVDSIEPSKVDLSLLNALEVNVSQDKLLIRLKDPQDSLSQQYISKYNGDDSINNWLTPTTVKSSEVIISLSQRT